MDRGDLLGRDRADRRRTRRCGTRARADPAGVDPHLPATRELRAGARAEQADHEPESQHRVWGLRWQAGRWAASSAPSSRCRRPRLSRRSSPRTPLGTRSKTRSRRRSTTRWGERRGRAPRLRRSPADEVMALRVHADWLELNVHLVALTQLKPRVARDRLRTHGGRRVSARGAESLEAVEDQIQRELELELIVAAAADHRPVVRGDGHRDQLRRCSGRRRPVASTSGRPPLRACSTCRRRAPARSRAAGCPSRVSRGGSGRPRTHRRGTRRSSSPDSR